MVWTVWRTGQATVMEADDDVEVEVEVEVEVDVVAEVVAEGLGKKGKR